VNKVDFKVNKKIEVLIDEKYFNSNIQDITEEYIAINIPSSSGEYLPLSKGTRIDVIYYEGENIFKFESTVIGRKFENIPILLLAKPKIVHKIQRRKYVRVPLVSIGKYTNLKGNPKVSTSIIESNQYFKAILVDLSGGGMKVKVSEQVKVNDYLLVSLIINGEETNIVGQTIRVIKDEEGRYVCGLTFQSLENSTRETIIKFIFKLMREQMKKI
jgi:c-di-GMP-binding flagellar brake protein YcgR